MSEVLEAGRHERLNFGARRHETVDVRRERVAKLICSAINGESLVNEPSISGSVQRCPGGFYVPPPVGHMPPLWT